MQLRAPLPDEAPAVLAVLAAREVADLGAPDYTLEDLREEWRLSEVDLAIDAASFAGVSDYQPESLESFAEEHLRAHDLDPELSRVAEHGEAMVGFLLARRWRAVAVGFVDILGVHPDHRRRGLGTALLRSAFSALASAGLREAQLGVASDNPRALSLYERIGMSPRFQLDTYERPVAGKPLRSPN